MKLSSYTTTYFSLALLGIISIWSVLFYLAIIDEVYDSIDDGLENSKILILRRASQDATVLQKTDFGESNYRIQPVSRQAALIATDQYQDTLLFMVNENDYEPVRMLKTFFHQQGHYYQLTIITSFVESDDLIEDLFYYLLWLYAVMVVCVIFINQSLLQRIWRPFYKLLNTLKDYRLDKPVPFAFQASKIDEFNDLQESVSKLLQNNLQVYQSQKQFIENASHELQTPVAISLNKLELLAEKSELTEEQATLMESVIGNLEKLTRLNKSLLLLSKIENKQFTQEQDIHVNAVVDKLLAEFSEQAQFKEVTLELEAKGELHQRMNKDLLEMMLSNLLKNAIIHNVKNGFVTVVIQPNQIAIHNSGPAQALDPDKVFKRFYKASASSQSTGLGLSIVKAIADLYGIKLRYQYEQHHCIIIDF